MFMLSSILLVLFVNEFKMRAREIIQPVRLLSWYAWPGFDPCYQIWSTELSQEWFLSTNGCEPKNKLSPRKNTKLITYLARERKGKCERTAVDTVGFLFVLTKYIFCLHGEILSIFQKYAIQKYFLGENLSLQPILIYISIDIDIDIRYSS